MLDSIFLSTNHWMTGSSGKKLIENSAWNDAGAWFRKLAGIIIALIWLAARHFNERTITTAN